MSVTEKTGATVRPQARTGFSWLAALVALGALLAGLAWAWASPVMSSPDDDYHMTSIWCPQPLATSGCVVGRDAKGRTTVQVPRDIGEYQCFLLKPERSAGCEVHGPETMMSARVDEGAYPGGYYRFMHLFVGPDLDCTILTMRTINVLLATVLLGAAAWAANPGTRRALAYTLVAFVPVGLFIVASINPSCWAIVGTTALLVGWHSVLVDEPGTRRRVSGAVAVAGAVMAAVARADAAFFIVAAVGGMAVFNWRRLPGLRAAWAVAAAACLAAVASLVTVMRQATQTATLGFGAYDKYKTPEETFWRNLPEIVAAPWGAFGGAAPRSTWGLGWFDVPMPAVVYVGASGIAAALLVIGLARISVGKVLAMTGFGLLSVAYPMYLLVASHDLLGHNYQPRYGLPALVGLVFAGVLLPSGRRAATLRGAQRWVVWAVLTIANGAALFTTMQRYIQGTNGPLDLRFGLDWWWSAGPTPMQVLIGGIVGFALLAFPIVWLNADARDAQIRTPGRPGVRTVREPEAGASVTA